jgi:hypothetical protein
MNESVVRPGVCRRVTGAHGAGASGVRTRRALATVIAGCR